jgi:transposase
MTNERSGQETTLSNLGALARRAAEASRSERHALEERESAVVAAVRAGARLDEIGKAAGVTKAAVSVIARKTLGARPGRGGPYRRRRGVEGALSEVGRAASRAVAATRSRRLAIDERDKAILAAVDDGIAVRTIAEALGMGTKVVRTLIRRRRDGATSPLFGAVASQ